MTRRLILCGVLVVLTASCRSPAPQFAPAAATPVPLIDYDTIHHPVLAREGMVVSQNRVASEVGRDILARGGNAVDAAVAVGFALAVTLPRAGNLGGSGYMLIHSAAEDRTLALDYRSAAPKNLTLEQLLDESGEIDWPSITFGAKAAGVPGTVAGLFHAWQRAGTLRWGELVDPALRLASEGITVTSDLAFALSAATPILSRYETSRRTYLDEQGRAPVAGARLQQPELAWTLRQIKRKGAETFYRGAVSERLIGAVQAAGGHLTRDDLAEYRVRERAPVETRYRQYTVRTTPLSSAGGLTLAQMLSVLSEFPVADYAPGSAAALHLLAEVMKRSAANRRVGLGDPDFVDVDIDRYLDPQLTRTLAADIDLARATPVAKLQPQWIDHRESRDTTHYSVVDRHGNAVSNTYTLGYSFGSGFVAEGTGVLLDNQLRNFSHRLDEAHANAMAPGKRMLSTMTPTIVLDEQGEVFLVTGTPGGSRIINVLLQVIVNVLDHGMNVAEATHQPRIHQGWRRPELAVENEINPDTTAKLRAMGHDIDVQQTMGSTQSIVRDGGLLQGAADPRRPGSAAIGVDEVSPN